MNFPHAGSTDDAGSFSFFLNPADGEGGSEARATPAKTRGNAFAVVLRPRAISIDVCPAKGA